MSRFPKVVPWASTAEYMDVGECLFSPDLAQRKRGVTVVKAWRARSRIPAAIEATANLVEMAAIDEEAQQTQSSHICSNQQLRHMYTMALVRFVNTIVDLEQRGLYAQSVASLAARIGMPAWFVELRHAGTHDHIPSLPVLRSACAQAVLWLGDYYWSRQTARTMPEDTQQQIRQAVARYATTTATAAGLESAKLRSDADHEEMNSAKAGLADLVARLHSDAVRLHLVPVLVEQGFLVSDEKKLRAKFPDCRLAPEFIARWEFPLGLFCDTWGPSLFLEELVSGIVAALVPSASADLGLFETGDISLSTSHAATLVAWVRWILEQSNSNIDPDTAKAAGGSLNVDVLDNGQTAVECIINIDDILEACLRNPGYYTRAVLKVISDVVPGLKRELKPFVDYMGKALAALVAIESGSGSSNKVGSKLKKKPVASERDLQDEEDVMRDRLSSVLGKSDAESNGMDIDNADNEMNEAASVNTPGARNAAATSSEPAATSGRWALAPVCSGAVSSIGTLADGSVPPLEWPAWLDDVPLQTASASS
ncbi:rRNA-processing protein las1 [Coemansia sp. Benny D160-2]|nr:rRNA-processing protein las1 [Coemansia sp. Benny D160-2]